MIGRWKKIQAQQGKKVVDAYSAIIKNNSNRFILYPNNKIIKEMWILFDSKTKTIHYLYGENLRQAKENAFKRYDSVLLKEV